MNMMLLIEKEPYIKRFLDDSISGESFYFKTASSKEEALQAIEHYEPEVVVINEDIDEKNILDFCQILRQKQTSNFPIILALNFYSTLNPSQLKDLNADFILKPFTSEELKKKIEEQFFKEKEAETASSFMLSEHEIIEKIKPYIKEEVKNEIIKVLKLLTEVIEHRYAE
jgi:DNA-binding response OmpR family regulator